MNLAEGLAREIHRVTELRCRYAALDGQAGINVKPALVFMDATIEHGMKAAGMNCAVTQLDALHRLQGFKE